MERPVKLAVSLIFKERELMARVEDRLVRVYGPLEPHEGFFPFDFTDYYYGEFGRPLERKLICFKRLVKLESIYKSKLITNRLEKKFSVSGKRTVNIDPGYLTEAKLILLTTKDYSHRVYLGKGIFAESTLHFQNGSFRAWPWTYPDYASSGIVSYFNEARKIYSKDIWALKKNTNK